MSSHERERSCQVEFGEGEINPEHVYEFGLVGWEERGEITTAGDGDLMSACGSHHTGREDKIIGEEDDHNVWRPR